MDEEQQRIRGYLQTQAAKLSVPELAAKVRADMEHVREAAIAVPPAHFFDAPSDGEWSANEVLAHVLDSACAGTAAIRGVLDSGAVPPAATDQVRSTEQRQSAQEWWQALLADRESLFERTRTAKGDEHLDVTWTHPFFGPLNWREWLLFQRIHDLDHARQIQAITAAVTA